MHRILFLIFFIQSLSVFANVTYTVVNCNDGDTCKIRSSTNLTLRVRLMAIDAPEVAHDQSPAQSFGYESKIFINQLIKGKNVELKFYTKDIYGRSLAEIFYSNENINLKMVETGMAEVYRNKKNKNFDLSSYLAAEKKAQHAKIGIWSQKDYISPAIWRKTH